MFRRFPLRFVGKRDRFAEMGDRLLEGRTAESLVARRAPPFIARVSAPAAVK